MPNIEKKSRLKLSKLVPRLASDHDGEVVATVAAIRRTLESAGLSLHELASVIAAEPIERIVFRDRVVEKEVVRVVVEERIVYRDTPQDLQLHAIAIDRGKRLLEHAPLTEKERTFVENMVLRASVEGDAFAPTPKQAKWLVDMSMAYREHMQAASDVDTE